MARHGDPADLLHVTPEFDSEAAGATGETVGTTIGTSAGLIAAANPTRRSIAAQNVHATNILYVGFTSSVGVSGANAGQKVSPGRSFVSDDYTGELWGIASGANTDVRVAEVG